MHNCSYKIAYCLLLIQGLLLGACRENQAVTVKGQVTEGYLNDPVNGVEVTIAFSAVSASSFSAGYEPVGTAVTDGSGNYTIEFDRVQAVDYRVTGVKEGFKNISYKVATSEWGVDEENNYDFEIFETATLEIRLVDQSPTSPSDRILFDLLPHSSGCSGCCPTTRVDYNGSDTTIFCDVYANQQINYEFTKLSNSGALQGTGSIYAAPGLNIIELEF